MIDIVTWRARIGSFHLSSGGPSRKRAKVQRSSSAGKWSLTVITILSLLAGSVNPGLETGKGKKQTLLYHGY